jgi:hypothetical protein
METRARLEQEKTQGSKTATQKRGNVLLQHLENLFCEREKQFCHRLLAILFAINSSSFSQPDIRHSIAFQNFYHSRIADFENQHCSVKNRLGNAQL